jgi:hypothetical protein
MAASTNRRWNPPKNACSPGLKALRSLVKILAGASERAVGAGVLIDQTEVVTCAHVVNLALSRDIDEAAYPNVDKPIRIRFHADGSQVFEARMVGERAWTPPSGGDLCRLNLRSDPPSAAHAATLSMYPVEVPKRFQCAGYPPGWDEGDFADGTVIGITTGGLYVLRPDTPFVAQIIGLLGDTFGRRPAGLIHRGFSGGPVEIDGKLVGLIGRARRRFADVSAFMIPLNELHSFKLTEALKADLLSTFSSTFPQDQIFSRLVDHWGYQVDSRTATNALARDHANLIEWAAQDPMWMRALIRVMIEERSGDPLVVGFMLKYPHYGPVLSSNDRELLRQCLSQVVRDYAALAALVAESLGLQLNDLRRGSSATIADANQYLSFLIRRADHFDQIEALIRCSLKRFSDPILEGKVRPLLDSIRSKRLKTSTIAADPFEEHNIGGKFLIDRTALRKALRGVIDDAVQARVIAVNGPPRSGKSHSVYYIEHIEQRLGSYEKIVIPLEQDEPPSTFDPPLLIAKILDLIGHDTTRIPQKTPDLSDIRWVRRLADHVVGQIKSRPRAVFIVLDGFGDQNVPALTRELIRELVRRADAEPKLRLALLDYTDDLLPIDSASRLIVEPISAFSESDLARFFVEYARAQGRADPPKEAIDTIVRSVLSVAPFGDPTRNERVAQEVAAWTERLK